MGRLAPPPRAAGTRPLLTDALRPVLEALAAADIRCTLAIKDINPPGCYLHPPELLFRFHAGDFTANQKLLLVTSSKDRTASYDDMSALLDAVLVALGDRAVVARPADVETSDLSTYLTAYELTWADRITEGI